MTGDVVAYTNKQFAQAMARRMWCAMLAKLVSPSFPVQASEALLDMLPALQHLPDHLFTPDTLTHVAMAKRRQSVPAFDEIIIALTDFRRTYLDDRAEAQPVQIAESRGPPSMEEVANVTAMLTAHRREMAAASIARQEANPSTAPTPLPDVTIKGEALQRLRAARAKLAGVAP